METKEENIDLFKLFSNYCYKKYRVIADKNNNEKKYFMVSFKSLNKIDNIKVSANLRIPCYPHSNNMIFQIRDKFPPFKILFLFTSPYEKGENNKFTEEQVYDILKLINELVHRLKFIKLTGLFEEYVEPFGNDFIDAEECSVCYELTITKTAMCDHSICRSCFQKLRQNFTCPICRRRTELEFSESDDE